MQNSNIDGTEDGAVFERSNNNSSDDDINETNGSTPSEDELKIASTRYIKNK